MADDSTYTGYTSSSFKMREDHIAQFSKWTSSVCTNCRKNTAYLANEMVNDVVNQQPWCAECIGRRFNEARDDEKKYPFFRHNEVQTPRMEHYAGLFDEDYMRDWSVKTTEWTTPVENRVTCDCDAKDFIMAMNEDVTAPFFMSCNECDKTWCVSCGDQKRAPYGTPYNAPSAHTTEANPNGCKNTRAAKSQQRQAQVTGLIKGSDYQICPMCHRHTSNGNDPAKVQCDGCATLFCFTCGLKLATQDWVPGRACSWRFGHHP